MSTTGGPGQGLTLALSVDATLSRLRSIQLPDWVTEPVDFTGLSELDWFNFLAATLQDGGQFTAEFYLNTEIALPTLRTVQEATITFAKQTPGSASGAIITGSGFITRLGHPNAVTGEPLIQTLDFKYDGIDTNPSWALEV